MDNVCNSLRNCKLLAIPVFADIDPKTLNLSPKSVEKCISKRTKAIMVADIHGLSSDMILLKIAKKHNLKIINDSPNRVQSIKVNLLVLLEI